MKNIDNAYLPAMPQSASELGYCVSDDVPKGLTKREMFAMHAMQGELAGSANHSRPEPEDVANYAVMCADALLDALDRRKKLDFSSKS